MVHRRQPDSLPAQHAFPGEVEPGDELQLQRWFLRGGWDQLHSVSERLLVYGRDDDGVRQWLDVTVEERFAHRLHMSTRVLGEP